MEPLRKRVKVYQLDSNGKWDDKGTGHVSCIYLDNICALGLLVKSENDNSIILQTKLSAEDIYQKQQDSLIVWTEPESQLDLALSFQDSVGCQEIWEHILQYQKQRASCEGVDVDLPPIASGNLQIIVDFLDAHLPILDKDRVVNLILKEDYIKGLLDVFDELEKNDDKPQLFQMFNIFKNLILFNDTSILEVLLSEEYLLRVMGALEYDPEISDNNRIKHREFLSQNVVFKQVVKFPSKSLINTIHQTFRIQYLKDVVLPRVLDDVTFSSLNSLIYFNNIDIVQQIQNDTDFLQKIFTQIKKSERNSEERKDLILFLQDLCNLAKGLQIQNKTAFFTVLESFGLFQTLSSTLDDEVVQTRISSTEIILSTLLHDPEILRSHLTSEYNGNNSKFLIQLINLFITDKDIGVKNQIVEIVKTLLEADYDSNEFFRLFYEEGINLLVSPLNETYKGEPTIPGDPSSNLDSFVLYNIIELIIYCIKHHCFRIKHFIVEEGIAKKILKFSTSNERYLVLGSIRFFRSMVNMKDDLYNQHIIQENLFEPIIEIFKANISKYNLLNSAIIELFQYIYKENIKDLVIYLVEKYKDLFQTVTYTDVLKQLILKYEQIKDSFGSPEVSCNNNNNNNNNSNNNRILHNSGGILKINKYQKTQKEIDEEEEEAYFNEDEEEEEEGKVQGEERETEICKNKIIYNDSEKIVDNNSNNNSQNDSNNSNNQQNNNSKSSSVKGDDFYQNLLDQFKKRKKEDINNIIDLLVNDKKLKEQQDDSGNKSNIQVNNESNNSKIENSNNKMEPDETVASYGNLGSGNKNALTNKNSDEVEQKKTPKRKLDTTNGFEENVDSGESSIKLSNSNSNNNNNSSSNEDSDSVSSASEEEEEDDNNSTPLENGKHKKLKRSKKDNSKNDNNTKPTPSELHV